MASPCSSSVVLAADQPEALALFYGALLEQAPQRGFSDRHWQLSLPGGGLLEIYGPSRARPLPRQRGGLALCLRSEGGAERLERWLALALKAGAALLEPARHEPFGDEAWLEDPEGNALLLLCISAP